MAKIKGWRGIGPNRGQFVEVEDGFDHAAAECGIQAMDETAPEYQEFREALVDWYFSGSWLEVRGDG